MKLRTLDLLLNKLSEESSWRAQEIMLIRIQASEKKGLTQNALLRAGVALTYSHWEGFIKSSSEHLLNYISHQRLTNRQLIEVYVVHSLRSHITKINETNDADYAVSTLNFIITELNKTSNISHKNYVDTESNLSSAVFDKIARSLGINVEPYTNLYPFINESIVRKRNSIAHGEKLEIRLDEFKVLSDRVLDLIRQYRTDIENFAVQKMYLRKQENNLST